MRKRTVMLRLYSLVTFSVTTLLILCFMASLTNLAHKPSSVSSQLHVQIQQAKLALNITADLRSLFSWNTKQIFVFVAVEYITSSNAVNQISLWDRIVTEKEQAKFHVYTSNKYSFLDQVWHAVSTNKKPLRKHYLEKILPQFIAHLRHWSPLLCGIHEPIDPNGLNPLVVYDWALDVDVLPLEVCKCLQLNIFSLT